MACVVHHKGDTNQYSKFNHHNGDTNQSMKFNLHHKREYCKQMLWNTEILRSHDAKQQ